MKWKKYTIYTTVEAEDLVSLMLNELGVGGVEIEDNIAPSQEDLDAQFVGIMPEMDEPDGTARVSFFIHLPDGSVNTAVTSATVKDDSYTINDRIWSEEELEELLKNIAEGLKEMSAYTDIGEGRTEESETGEEDWRDNWKEFFKPIPVGNILILPSWLEVPDEYKDKNFKTLVIDPGNAFGTGSHETTKIVIPELEKYLKAGDSVLDIGTGSGILAIAAALLGAGETAAIDVDSVCEETVKENFALNSFDCFKYRTIDLLEESERVDEVLAMGGPFDIVCANILAPVIKELAGKGVVDRLTKKNGYFITSGILDIYEEDVVNAFKDNDSWEISGVTHMGEWVSVTAKKVK